MSAWCCAAAKQANAAKTMSPLIFQPVRLLQKKSLSGVERERAWCSQQIPRGGLECFTKLSGRGQTHLLHMEAYGV